MYKEKNKPSNNIIYGRNSCISAIEQNRANKALLQENFSENAIISMLKKAQIPYEFKSQKELNNVCAGGNHQGIVLFVKEYQYSSLREIVFESKKSEQPLVLLLDEINDPHNLGAIIRSADAFGIDGIIMKSKNQVLVTPTVEKVSTGASNYVKIALVPNLCNAIRELKENGFWVYAAEANGSVDLYSEKFDRPTALVLGSEGFGISKLVLDNSDLVISIPMRGHVNSLNVSTSAGILLSVIRHNK